MTFETTLAEAGFGGEAVKKFADNEWFVRNYANKFSEEILERINLIAAIYNTDADSVRDAITKFPPFAGYDHKRVVEGIREVYGWSAEDAGKAVFKHPPFAGLDHKRVMRQLGRIGRIIGLDEDRTKESILHNPVIAGCSTKRYLAAIDVVNHLRTEGELSDKDAIRLCLSYISKSPYVPGTDRLRITQVLRRGGEYTEDPPLMVTLRKSMRSMEDKENRIRLRT